MFDSQTTEDKLNILGNTSIMCFYFALMECMDLKMGEYYLNSVNIANNEIIKLVQEKYNKDYEAIINETLYRLSCNEPENLENWHYVILFDKILGVLCTVAKGAIDGSSKPTE